MNKRDYWGRFALIVTVGVGLLATACGGGGGGGSSVIPEPTAAVTKTADPTSVPETGGDVTFTVRVTNIGSASVDVESLTDNEFGDLDGQGDCALPQTLPSTNSSYTCSFTETLSGSPATPHENTVTALLSSGQIFDASATVDFTEVLVVDFAPTSPTPAPQTISLQPAGVSGQEFDLDVKVTGAFDGFFGAAFRVVLPASVSLTGSSSAGSLLLAGGADTEFDAVQQGTEVLVVATRVQGAGGTFVPGIDVTAGSTAQLLRLSFRVDAETTGPVSLGSPRQVELCDDVAETCGEAVGVVWSGGTLTAN